MTEVPSVRIAADIRHALRALARKSVHAVAHAGGAYSVHATPEGEPLLMLPAALVAQMRSRGWLQRDGADRVRIAAAGLRALRRIASSPAGIDPVRQSRGDKADGSGNAPHETPLAWLRRRKDGSGQTLITQPQYEAGERLADDYRRAQIMQRVTADWSGVASARRMRRGAPGAGIEPSDASVAARERVNRALDAVGAELAGILIDVCCHETGLETAERAEGWPQRAAKVVLQLALTALARHYGLIAPERPAFTRLRHWGDEDYKPTTDAWQ